MKYQEYVPLAVRTAKKLKSKAENLNHAVIGLLSEVNEYNDAVVAKDTVNIKEELGDKLWYSALAYKCLEKYMNNYEPNVENFVDFTNESVHSLEHEFTHLLSKFSDPVKKFLIYEKEPTEEQFQQLASILCAIIDVVFCLFKAYNLDVNNAMHVNIEKLKDRYPEAYSNEKATNRNLEKERKSLESEKDG